METELVKEGTLLWEPKQDLMHQANVTRYMKWLKDEKGLTFNDYGELWQWSVTDIEDFWASLWAFFDIKASKPYTGLHGRQAGPRTLSFL